jgi:predicted DsbA family dithiol-disulfide isomerase
LARKMLGSESAPPELLNHATLLRYGRELGLDTAALESALSGQLHQSAIDRDVEVARGLGIEATPAFIINGYALLGAQPLRRFDRLVRLALEESGGSTALSPVPVPKMQ